MYVTSSYLSHLWDLEEQRGGLALINVIIWGGSTNHKGVSSRYGEEGSYYVILLY